MSEPKTIREAYHHFIDADSTTESTVYEFLTCYGESYIIPGANAVVTAEGLEAAAAARYRVLMGADWRTAHQDTRDYHLRATRAALEAAGITVVKEVVTVEGHYIPSMRLVGRTPLLINRKEREEA